MSTHVHPCKFEPQGCRSLIECSGSYFQNYDGEPPVCCTARHLDNGEVFEAVCDDCEETRCACGEPKEPGASACGDCYDPEPEAFSGGFAENH